MLISQPSLAEVTLLGPVAIDPEFGTQASFSLRANSSESWRLGVDEGQSPALGSAPTATSNRASESDLLKDAFFISDRAGVQRLLLSQTGELAIRGHDSAKMTLEAGTLSQNAMQIMSAADKRLWNSFLMER